MVSALTFGGAACASSGAGIRSRPFGSRAVGPAAARRRPIRASGSAPGLLDAEEAIWNLRLLSRRPPPERSSASRTRTSPSRATTRSRGTTTASRSGTSRIRAAPELVTDYVCPASQSDVSVYGNLLFVSGEGLEGRLDCGTEGVQDRRERRPAPRDPHLRHQRHPESEYVANVQTCRGSHTHTVLEDPGDATTSTSTCPARRRCGPAEELPGCSRRPPEDDPDSALFRIEVIRVPLADPEAGEIVSSPRIFDNLVAPPDARPGAGRPRRDRGGAGAGAFVVEIMGEPRCSRTEKCGPPRSGRGPRGGTGAPDGRRQRHPPRDALPDIIAADDRPPQGRTAPSPDPPSATTSPCTRPSAWPAGRARGTGCCSTSRIPVNPVASTPWRTRTSPTGTRPPSTTTARRCSSPTSGAAAARPSAARRSRWSGARTRSSPSRTGDALPELLQAPRAADRGGELRGAQRLADPRAGRDIMVQAWYQGGISIFDWTDPANPSRSPSTTAGP
jgi:hypothetical protein